ncbi:MAG: hypothetical protein EBQ96_09760 [Proteobacteria bacterium]|nr:hypothetical protein [Pseudomonadota bacterium]
MTKKNGVIIAAVIIILSLSADLLLVQAQKYLNPAPDLNSTLISTDMPAKNTGTEAKQTPSLHIGEAVTGKVTRVVDGDSLYVADKKLRLWGVDAPDKDDFGYKESRKALRELVQDKTLMCVCKELDRHGRSMAICTLENGDDIGKKLIRTGWALDYRKHTHGYYEKAEDEAKAAKRGLWAPR